jgi:hypothetical protein
VAIEHVNLQELLVLEAHVAEDARDRLSLDLGQLWSIFELEHGVKCVLLVDLVNLLLEMVTTEVVCGGVDALAAKRTSETIRRVKCDVMIAQLRWRWRDVVASSARSWIANQPLVHSLSVPKQRGIVRISLATVKARCTAHFVMHHANVTLKVLIMSKRSSTVFARIRSQLQMNSLVVSFQIALLAELLVTLGALVVLSFVRIVNAIFVVAQSVGSAEASQTNVALRTTRTIVHGCFAQRVHEK